MDAFEAAQARAAARSASPSSFPRSPSFPPPPFRRAA